MNRKVQQALLLIDNLLNWASEEFNNETQQKEEVFALHYLVDEITAFYQEMNEEDKEIVLLQNDRGFLFGDSNQIKTIIRNLLNNALKYGKSTVWVESHHAGSEMILRIMDDGSGLDLEESQDEEEQAGWGIGLDVVRKFTHAHKGKFRLYRSKETTIAECRLPTADLSQI